MRGLAGAKRRKIGSPPATAPQDPAQYWTAHATIPRRRHDRLCFLRHPGTAHDVVPGRVLAGDLTDGAMVTTLEGGQVTIDLDGGAKVDGVNIIATDIVVSNGVVHLIDGVLIP